MYDFDHDLFLSLNFDGGTLLDRIMLTISGTAMWIPLYVLILYLVFRRWGWKQTILFVVLMVAVLALSDMVSGIFKHNGLLGDVMPNFTPRLRPMFTPELEGLAISPDSLATLRRSAAPENWAVHVPMEALGGRYGTVSAHAATIVALATLSIGAIRRSWFTGLMLLCTVLICYSRIYLGKHFPMDLVWGALLGWVLGYAASCIFRRIVTRRQAQ